MTSTVLGCEKLKVGIAANEGTVENLPAKYTGPDAQSFCTQMWILSSPYFTVAGPPNRQFI